MNIPILDLKSQHARIAEELRSAIDRVLKSGVFCLGPEVEAFESAVSLWTEPARAVGLSNGTDALLVALLALEIGAGDEVIIPPFTFFATASAVIRAGAKPVFVDINERTFNIDPDLIEAAITPKTRAIIPVHLYGQCADMERITPIARKHGLRIVEDAAQALGARRNGRRAGAFGDLACFSFYPTKNLGALGEAGLISSSDEALLQRCRILRNQGMEPRYEHHVVGGNYRMDAIQAAVLGVKLKHLESWNERRRHLAEIYNKALDGTTVQTPYVEPGNEHIYHQYTIRTPRRDDLAAHLLKNGIASGVYYPIPLHQQAAISHLTRAKQRYPVAERACREVLSLPIHPELTDEQVITAAASVRAF
jgi:dTDP-4-amino-4,6-dideoxygalactose transaminase